MQQPSLPKLIRFLILHASIGFVIAAAMTLGLLWANIGGVGTLICSASCAPMPAILLWFMLGLTCSSCQMGAAIMLLADDPSDSGRGRRSLPSMFARVRTRGGSQIG